MNKSRTLIAACIPLALTEPSFTQVIDFETLPNGSATTDNMLIDAQYEAEYGVRFSLVDPITGVEIGFPRIAKVGSPLTAFVSCGGDDTPDSGLGVGDSFLTDDGILGSSAILRISYTSPVRAASGVILDVDARSAEPGAVEAWNVYARSVSLQDIDVVQIVAPQGPDEPGCEGFNGEGDGSARGFSFTRPTADIAYLDLQYVGNAKLGSVGLAFDNFSPATSIEELSVELTVNGAENLCEGGLVFLGFTTSGGFSDQSSRWERRLSPDDPWEDVEFFDEEYFPVDGEQVRVLVDDGSIEVASEPYQFEVNRRGFDLRDDELIEINDAALFLFGQSDPSPEETWGDDPTTFENEEIETVSEGVHIVPMLTANGAHLAVIFNTTGGTTPGTVQTEIISLGWEPSLIFVDDPDDPMYNDTYTEGVIAPGMKRITLDQTWAGNKTDGFIIGPMTDAGSCSISFTESSGLSTGLCFNGDGDPIPFDFTDGMTLDFSSSCSDPCPADLTDDGAYDFFDVSAFLTAYGIQDPIADWTDDGSFDFFDISAFLTAYSLGCP
ncbi:MAG: hypothetical protein JJ974_06410 [Phycisphaerales bacterium]|nr:hypothetical protein [Phycisphaerales bacterium]